MSMMTSQKSIAMVGQAAASVPWRRRAGLISEYEFEWVWRTAEVGSKMVAKQETLSNDKTFKVELWKKLV